MTHALSIGVDLDGVLANQVVGVLPRIEAEYGVALSYDDIVDWRLPISDTDIAKEIVSAQSERAYVLAMPVHPGAQEMLEALRERFRVVILTTRAGNALDWSVEWLRRNSLPFDEIAGSEEAKKSLHGVDALVDDYLGNIEEFLRETSGSAVLVNQPWNRVGRDILSPFAARTAVASALTRVPGLIVELIAQRAPLGATSGQPEPPR